VRFLGSYQIADAQQDRPGSATAPGAAAPDDARFTDAAAWLDQVRLGAP